jgi:hypothetical protein
MHVKKNYNFVINCIKPRIYTDTDTPDGTPEIAAAQSSALATICCRRRRLGCVHGRVASEQRKAQIFYEGNFGAPRPLPPNDEDNHPAASAAAAAAAAAAAILLLLLLCQFVKQAAAAEATECERESSSFQQFQLGWSFRRTVAREKARAE